MGDPGLLLGSRRGTCLLRGLPALPGKSVPSQRAIGDYNSDGHEGSKAAVEQVLAGLSWQPFRVYFMRNVLAHIANGSKSGGDRPGDDLRAAGREPAGRHLAEALKAMARGGPKRRPSLRLGTVVGPLG
jgi:hypothetical protein